MQKIFEKIGCPSNDVGPRPLQWIAQQSLVRINWNFKTKREDRFPLGGGGTSTSFVRGVRPEDRKIDPSAD